MTKPSNIIIPLFLETTLYFKEFENEEKKVITSSKEKPKTKTNESGYEKVGNKIFRLGNVMLGIHKFVPVEFTNDFASILYATVHSQIVNVAAATQTVFTEFKALEIYTETIGKEERKMVSPSD